MSESAQARSLRICCVEIMLCYRRILILRSWSARGATDADMMKVDHAVDIQEHRIAIFTNVAGF